MTELPRPEDATDEDLRLAVSAAGNLARYGGFLRAALAGIYAERRTGAEADAAFAAWWPSHAVRHNSRSPVAAREAFQAGWDAAQLPGSPPGGQESPGTPGSP